MLDLARVAAASGERGRALGEPSPGGVGRFRSGHAGNAICIPHAGLVLDVGSGHHPHPRADVLFEMHVEDNADRAGDAMDATDTRLVGTPLRLRCREHHDRVSDSSGP